MGRTQERNNKLVDELTYAKPELTNYSDKLFANSVTRKPTPRTKDLYPPTTGRSRIRQR